MIKLVLPQERDSFERIRQLVNNLNLLAEPSPQIDVTGINYITPLTILPLAMRIANYDTAIPEIMSDDNRALTNLLNIGFPNGVNYSPEEQKELSDHRSIYKTSLNTRSDQSSYQKLSSMVQDLSNLIIKYLKQRSETVENYVQPVSYFLTEICDNVHEHAEANSCWIYFRFWKPRGELEFCIADDGIGIKQRYDRSGFGTHDHIDALEQAIRGNSTKNDLRGFGIGSMIRLFTSREVRGEACIVSGDACYYNSHTGLLRIGRIPTFWKGVIFSVRLTRPLERISVAPYAAG